MLETLLGVIVGGAVTAVCTIWVQARAVRSIARLEIYTSLLERADLKSASRPRVEAACDTLAQIRRRAVLLKSREVQTISAADQLLRALRDLILEEGRDGTNRSSEIGVLLSEYQAKLHILETQMSRSLRWPA